MKLELESPTRGERSGEGQAAWQRVLNTIRLLAFSSLLLRNTLVKKDSGLAF